MFERWRKDFHEKEYQRGQEGIAEEIITQETVAHQARLNQIANVATETIAHANELAADGDPHKRQVADLLKNAAIGVMQQATSGRVPAERSAAIEPDPFLKNSKNFESSLPGSTPKALPHEPIETPKRKRGRPPKNPKD